MKNNLTEHVQSLSKEFQDLKKVDVQDVEFHCEDCEKRTLSHLLQSQLKTIELVKEELEGNKLEVKHQDMCLAVDEDGKVNEHYCDCRYQEIVAYNNGITKAITLLDTIIQDIKSQIK
jgi:hypothetical protein